jgi:hypothetical protein
MERLCYSNELSNSYSDMICSQLEIFEKNFNDYENTWSSVWDNFIKRVLNVTVNIMFEKGFSEAEAKAREIYQRQFSS